MKPVTFKSYPETNGFVKKLVIFFVISLLYQPSIQPNNDSFKSKLERIQYNAALFISGAV